MKLLVTTDFSANSKSAIKFASLLANKEAGSEITFYHAVQVMKPTSWSDGHFKKYLDAEIKRLTADLQAFVGKSIAKHLDKKVKVKYLIENSLSTEKAIIDAAKKNKANFICIATKGAGMLRKLMGTHTEYLVNNSPIPVCAVPSDAKLKEVAKLTYLSDLENIKKEMTQVVKLNNALRASVEILHFSMVDLEKFELDKAAKILSTDLFAGARLTVEENNINLSLVEKVDRYVKDHKPHLIVMFTKRNKGFFESLFLPSKSAELTFTTKVPVIVYPK
jgi:nucleotide-binding universal stress UspA family protein